MIIYIYIYLVCKLNNILKWRKIGLDVCRYKGNNKENCVWDRICRCKNVIYKVICKRCLKFYKGVTQFDIKKDLYKPIIVLRLCLNQGKLKPDF